ncbi:hypothetical protein KCU88_g5145, partial [Aureobasidium melanogenum]
MNGGLYCDEDGNIQKPFPDRPYCEETPNNIGVVNNAGSHVSFCQTVLPGNEAMLIPTLVGESANLAVPDTKYWCGTAAHYYINPPGVGPDEACVWGDKSKPVGNWSPYVAGANIDASGETFIKLGWNPIYLEPATPFRTEMPNWGVKIDCPDGNCNGLPCAIDPTKNNVNEMVGSASDGAGGGAFCVVTVPKGSTANFVVFTAGGDSSSGSGSGSSTSSTSNGGDKQRSTSLVDRVLDHVDHNLQRIIFIPLVDHYRLDIIVVGYQLVFRIDNIFGGSAHIIPLVSRAQSIGVLLIVQQLDDY